LFNLRHASLRNVIERIFGVIKRKFKILNITPEFSLDTQTHLIFALVALYNHIRTEEGIQAEIEEDIGSEIDEGLLVDKVEESAEMSRLRDQIAKEMWKDYCSYIGREI
jgi:hypothetical protein